MERRFPCGSFASGPMNRFWFFALFGALIAFRASTPGAIAEIPRGWKEAARYSAEHNGFAFLILKSGRVVFEDYSRADRDCPYRIYSGTKGFWALAAVAAVQDGILSLDERVSDSVPEWRRDPIKKQVTVRQLLNFTSGLEPGFFLHGSGFEDRDRIALHLPMVARPGSAFLYGPSSLQVFHHLLEVKLARYGETPKQYLERRVLRPLGLGPQRYLEDGKGNPLLATGFVMTARQWARLGNALVRGGRPIVEPRFLQACFEGSRANGAFGIGFWTNRQASLRHAREVSIEGMLHHKWWQQDWTRACICKDAPVDLVAAVGSGSQRMYVIPSQGLVIVRQGWDRSFSDAHFLRLFFSGTEFQTSAKKAQHLVPASQESLTKASRKKHAIVAAREVGVTARERGGRLDSP